MFSRLIFLPTLVLAMSTLGACKSKTTQRETAAPAPEKKAPTSDDANKTNDSTNSPTQVDDIAAPYGKAWYLAYDGKTDYSAVFLDYSKDELKVADESLVKLEDIKWRYSAQQIDKIIEEDRKDWDEYVEEEKASNNGKLPEGMSETYPEKEVREDLSGSFPAVKFIPQKAGTTEITLPTYTEEGQTKLVTYKLHVYSYDQQLIAMGKKRYEVGGSGTRRPCMSCHGGGGHKDAVPHQLGGALNASDQALLKWIKEGKHFDTDPDFKPAISSHKWEFASDQEEKAILAYLRSLVAKDPTKFLEAEDSFFERLDE